MSIRLRGVAKDFRRQSACRKPTEDFVLFGNWIVGKRGYFGLAVIAKYIRRNELREIAAGSP
jgi:hypothetical protein